MDNAKDILAIWDAAMSRLQDLGMTGRDIAMQCLSLSITLAFSNGVTRKEFDEYVVKLWRRMAEESKKLENSKKPKSLSPIGRA